jgi:hypothetical protein
MVRWGDKTATNAALLLGLACGSLIRTVVHMSAMHRQLFHPASRIRGVECGWLVFRLSNFGRERKTSVIACECRLGLGGRIVHAEVAEIKREREREREREVPLGTHLFSTHFHQRSI